MIKNKAPTVNCCYIEMHHLNERTNNTPVGICRPHEIITQKSTPLIKNREFWLAFIHICES